MLFAKALVGVVSLIAASVAPCAAFNNHTITPTIESRSTEEAEESLFNQDFEGAISEDYGSNFTIENGKGIVNTQEQFTIPFTGVTSNNYEIDFDVAFNGNSSSNIFIRKIRKLSTSSLRISTIRIKRSNQSSTTFRTNLTQASKNLRAGRTYAMRYRLRRKRAARKGKRLTL